VEWKGGKIAARLRYLAKPEKKLLTKVTQRKWYREVRETLLGKLGGKCGNCGFLDTRALQIDHIYGNGNKERAKFGAQYTYYKHLLDMNLAELEINYQLLCANCNWIKRYENNEVPNYYTPRASMDGRRDFSDFIGQDSCI